MRIPSTKTGHKNVRRYLVGVSALVGTLLLGACTDQQQASTAKTTPQATAPPAAKAASPAAVASPPARAASPAAAPSPAVRAASPSPSPAARVASPSPAARVASPSPAARVASPSPAAGAVSTDSGAATLRTRLNTLLQEHVYLAADVTDAALNNRSAELEAAQEAINQNTRELGNIIESAYGVGVERTFEDVWTRHTGYLVDYARAAAANDQAQKQQALDRLTEFRRDLDALLTAANPNLPPGSVADLLEGHVMTQLAVIDAQAANDPSQVYLRLEEAAEHMDNIGTMLATAIARQFPDQFAGSADSAAAAFRSNLNLLLREHVHVAAHATDAAIDNRSGELEATNEFLNQNARELGNLIQSAYGVGVERTFEDIWTRHTGYLVDYARAVAANDQAQKQQALDRLAEFRRDLDALLTAPNPNLPPGSVANLLEGHVRTQLAVIDAQAANDPSQVYLRLEEAAEHVDRIAETLASAIVRQFPDVFR